MRIATFNVENLSDTNAEAFARRLPVMRPALRRLKADVICFQEVHGQGPGGDAPYTLRALETLLEETPYATYSLTHTTPVGQTDAYAERNLVTAVRPDWSVDDIQQIRDRSSPMPQYRPITANPPQAEASSITWERPLLYTRLEPGNGLPTLHVLNAHFKSKIPSNIAGQKIDRYTWRTAAAWAEGFFISSMKRVGAALGARIFIGQLFDADPDAHILLCGDLNAESHEVPVLAILGQVQDTNNPDLAGRIMMPAETSVPEPSRFTLYHHGRGVMLDHLLISRPLLACYQGTEIHNEMLHDESVAFATDDKFPESDHAPVVASFDLSVETGLIA